MGPDCHPWASTPRGSGSTGLGMTALHEPPHLVQCPRASRGRPGSRLTDASSALFPSSPSAGGGCVRCGQGECWGTPGPNRLIGPEGPGTLQKAVPPITRAVADVLREYVDLS